MIRPTIFWALALWMLGGGLFGLAFSLRPPAGRAYPGAFRRLLGVGSAGGARAARVSPLIPHAAYLAALRRSPRRRPLSSRRSSSYAAEEGLMGVHFAPRGHATFDVYDGPQWVGSVWSYHEGWAAFNRQLTMVGGFFPSRESAAEVLTRKREPDRVSQSMTGVSHQQPVASRPHAAGLRPHP